MKDQSISASANGAFYESVTRMMTAYRKQIGDIRFAAPEREAISSAGTDEEGLLAALTAVFNSSLELNRIMDQFPDGIYVVDEKGITVRMNKALESHAETTAEQMVGRSVYDLEREGRFLPVTHVRVLREKRKLSFTQTRHGFAESSVIAIPVYDGEQRLIRSLSVSRNFAEINNNVRHNIETNRSWDSRSLPSQRETVVIGQSPRMSQVLALADEIKDVESNILITGETGVGKGVLTRYIHENSFRHRERLVEINCGAIPESLLESELFGYESGAFTGADKKGKPGLIELADRGTVFFDEISELPLLLQVKILFFLQNKQIIRLGGTKNIRIDARVIAASNRDMEKLVREGKFRSDLYYRLNVVQIDIPPLRVRKEDIMPAAELFLKQFNLKYRRNIELDEETVRKLLAYDWPGNLRELENFIERLVVTGRHRDIAIRAWEERIGGEADKKTDGSFSLDSFQLEGLSLSQIMDKVEMEIIGGAYDKYQNSYKVAEHMGISQAGAHRKIAKYLEEKKRREQIKQRGEGI
jgi:transcriptional regulator with PAS, ATPase and Fis domain